MSLELTKIDQQSDSTEFTEIDEQIVWQIYSQSKDLSRDSTKIDSPSDSVL